ncbi:MAG: hypothetical protein RJA57_1859 [Bacteroidota bacterium]
MKLFPASALEQLEFDKVKARLASYCRAEQARDRALSLIIHTHREPVETELRQSHEYRQLLVNRIQFPDDKVFHLNRQLRLLSVPGAVLTEDDLDQVRALALYTERIFRWFDRERREAFPALSRVIHDTRYEKTVSEWIDAVIDEQPAVRDNASETLREVRMALARKRQELRRIFDKVVSRLNKQGYLAAIEESFMNGRRVVAIFAEQKRMVRGILHGESDSRKTAFIEPEETVDLNNQVRELESEEAKEVYRILKDLTARLSVHADLLQAWYAVNGTFDFIFAKAKLAAEMQAEFPAIVEEAGVQLVEARHPLLLLLNLRAGKPTVPVTLTLDREKRILVISGPNAGGKTVAMKTVGLLQVMVQSGLLVPVHPSSRFGIFKKLMIHIGDTQSLEFELSTYSSHLLHMKQFMEEASGRTLFFIDELGSGSDPAMGGAFAEVILQELAHRQAFGIVTTHYLNLKVMAGKTPGILNGAMSFDEERLQPLYRLQVGKPGSSYTFSIAERIGMDRKLIARARELVDPNQFRLEKLLNRTEKDLRRLEQQERELRQLLKENERLKKEMQQTMDRERQQQQVKLLREQNRISEERMAWLKDMERKLRQLLQEWKKADNKAQAVKAMEALLFRKNDKKATGRLQKKIEEKFTEVGGEILPGVKVKLRKNHQVGEVLELRGKRAVVRIGQLPMQVELKDLVVVKEKTDASG